MPSRLRPEERANVRAPLTFAFGLLTAFGAAAPARAQSFPPGFNDELIAQGLNVPTTFAFLPDNRILVAEQSGAIRIVDQGAVLSPPAITIPVESYDEQGLLGLVPHPSFPNPSYVYVFYTPFTGNQTGNVNRVSRFTFGATTINPASEVVLLDNIPAGLGFHLAGCLRFGADGNLYISTGDTGWSTPYPQDLSLLQGKILRIRPDGSIPADNPFVSTPGARDEIYQWGLRNPFRFSVQPGTSNVFIGDVGFNAWEEVNYGPAGANFGWPNCEGNCGTPGYTNPIYQYSHSLGSAAIVGNVFYQGNNFPAQYSGNYFFFDHSRGHLGRMVLGASNQVLSVTMPFIETASEGWLSGPVDLVLGNDGALYYCTYFPGEIRRIFYTGPGNRNPTAIASGSPTAGYPTLNVQFSSAGSYDVDGDTITYDWNFGDATAHSTAANPTHGYTANGIYNATLTVSDGFGGFATSTPVKITVGNLPPALVITAPTAAVTFAPGEVITFAGTGSDPEEGPLPGSRLHWRVNLHHLNHIHPVIIDQTGSTGAFVAEDHGENLADLYYRIDLWAEDLTGLGNQISVDVLPDLSYPFPITRTFEVAADNRDATSILNDVRVSGYNAPAEPTDFVGSDSEQESSAMEFLIDIPAGSTIQEANLLVTAAAFQSASPTGGMRINLYNVLDAQPFQNGSFGDLANHHPLHPIGITWAAPTNWVNGTEIQSTDVAFLVQAWMNLPGYVPGKNLGLCVTDGTIAVNRYYGWNDSSAPGPGPRLRVRYVPPGATSVTTLVAPPGFSLSAPRPNPFTDGTEVSFALERAGVVRLTIYDAAGRLVRTLLNRPLGSGVHNAAWDGRSRDGLAAPGVYFLRLESGGESASRRIVRVR